jgi:hypothetical protein
MKSEYDPDGLQAQADGRNLFLQAIRDCELETAPKNPHHGRLCRVLIELTGTPFERFQSLYDCTYYGLSSDLLNWNLFAEKWTEDLTNGWTQVFTNYGEIYGYIHPLPNLMNNISPVQYFAWLKLRESLAEWAIKWNLATWKDNDSWFFDHMLYTLYLWRAAPTARDELFMPPLSYSIKSLPVRNLRTTVVLELEADLAMESRAKAAERIDRKLKEVRDAFLDGLERLEAQRRAPKSKDIRADHPFSMLVRYVIQDWSNDVIREKYKYQDKNEVSRSNNRTAKLISLILPNRRGRQHKAVN